MIKHKSRHSFSDGGKITTNMPCRNIAEAKALLTTVKEGIQMSTICLVYPKHIIEAIATEKDPFEKIMEDREELIKKTHEFLNQINSLEKIMDAAESGSEKDLSYESVGKDFLDFQDTFESQLNELQRLYDLMKERIKAAVEFFEKQITKETEE